MNLQDLIYKVNDLRIGDDLNFSFSPISAIIRCNKRGKDEKTFAIIPNVITGEYKEEDIQGVSDWIDEYFGYL